MSKVVGIVGGVLVLALIAAAALFGVVAVQAQDPTPEADSEGALDDQPPGEFSEEFHVFMRERMDAARENALQDAVAQGLITQEQADWLLEHPYPGRRGGPGGPGERGPELSEEARTFLHNQMEAALAEALGMSVEELEEAKANGTRIDELAAAQGIDLATLRETMDAAHQNAVEQALEQGLITQEQADWLLTHPRPGHRGGPGGPSGWRPDFNEGQAPATDS